MRISSVAISAALAVSFGVAGVAVASDQMGKPATMVDKDLGKLSVDGVSAYDDIGLARLAIYDGMPDKATKLVDDAMTSLSRARSDDAVFMKAEADLTPPKSAETASGSTQAPSKQAIAWVPVDGQFMLDETLAPTASKTSAVNDANTHLHNGEPDKARQALKVAAVDADYVVALAPLNQTTQDVRKASELLSKHDYYGASQQLRAVQASLRYDTVVFQDDPHEAANKAASNTAKD